MTDWREGYKAALREFVLKKGQPMRVEGHDPYGKPEVNYYGWTDYDVADHFTHYRRYRHEKGDEPCTAFATAETTITEEHFGQFQGTDYEGSDQESVLVMHPVHCACGEYKDLYWGYAGSMGDVILGVVGD